MAETLARALFPLLPREMITKEEVEKIILPNKTKKTNSVSLLSEIIREFEGKGFSALEHSPPLFFCVALSI